MGAEFVSHIREGDHEAAGWSSSMYGVSKLLEIAYTKALARDLAKAADGETHSIAVHAVCPGWCSTSMSSHKGPRSADKGAETPLWLATATPAELEAAKGPATGGFWVDKAPKEW